MNHLILLITDAVLNQTQLGFITLKTRLNLLCNSRVRGCPSYPILRSWLPLCQSCKTRFLCQTLLHINYQSVFFRSDLWLRVNFRVGHYLHCLIKNTRKPKGFKDQRHWQSKQVLWHRHQVFNVERVSGSQWKTDGTHNWRR